MSSGGNIGKSNNIANNSAEWLLLIIKKLLGGTFNIDFKDKMSRYNIIFAFLGTGIMSYPWIVRLDMTNHNIVGGCFECVKILHILSST